MATNTEQLKKYKEQLQKLDSKKDEFSVAVTKEVAARLLRKVKLRTPVGEYKPIVYTKKNGETIIYNEGKMGGELRRHWRIDENVKKDGNTYSIDVFNDLKYAPYVEYGHRQQVGRFVPQIGKRLVRSWVNGRFMLTRSEDEIEEIAPKLVEKRLTEWIGDTLNDSK